MATTYKTEYGDLAALFSSGWENETPVQYENLPYTPSTVSWVRFCLLPGKSVQGSIGAPGSNYFRYPGVIEVQIFVPSNTGANNLRDMADKAIGIFHNAIKAGYQFSPGYTVNIPNSGKDGWYQMNAVIPYTRTSIK